MDPAASGRPAAVRSCWPRLRDVRGEHSLRLSLKCPPTFLVQLLVALLCAVKSKESLNSNGCSPQRCRRRHGRLQILRSAESRQRYPSGCHRWGRQRNSSWRQGVVSEGCHSGSNRGRWQCWSARRCSSWWRWQSHRCGRERRWRHVYQRWRRHGWYRGNGKGGWYE